MLPSLSITGFVITTVNLSFFPSLSFYCLVFDLESSLFIPTSQIENWWIGGLGKTGKQTVTCTLLYIYIYALNSVNSDDKAILCDHCNKWVHTNCNEFEKKDHNRFQNITDKTFYCIKCLEDIIDFNNLLDSEFDICVKKGIHYLHSLNLKVNFSPIPD